MDCCGNTFRREPISRDMTGGKFKRWPMRSTIDRERHSGGIHQRKCLPINYTRDHDTVLRRPVESALTSGVTVMDGVVERAALAGAEGRGVAQRTLDEAGVFGQ